MKVCEGNQLRKPIVLVDVDTRIL